MKPNSQYKYLTFIAMVAAIIFPCSSVAINKIILIGSYSASAGTLLTPFWFIISDLITEVYGYKVSRQVFWYALFCNFLFASFSVFFVNLHSSSSWGGQAAYTFVFGNLLHIFFSGLAALIIGGFINTYLISKWKIMIKGKYFWLRSIGASTAGEAIYTILAFAFIFIGKLPLTTICMLVMWSYIFKVSYAFVCAFPANLIAKYLKNKEMVDIYDTNISFNPFKL